MKRAIGEEIEVKSDAESYQEQPPVIATAFQPGDDAPGEEARDQGHQHAMAVIVVGPPFVGQPAAQGKQQRRPHQQDEGG